MNMIDVHAQSLESSISVHHEFISRYNKNAKTIYAFVEGKDDPSFYRGFIDDSLPEDWCLEIWASGGKDNVLTIHKDLDWRTYKKKQVVFFIDRDLSEFTDEVIPNEENIYVTDKYSIENDVVSRNTCERILKEVFGFTETPYQEMNTLLDQYDREFNKFLNSLVPVMAVILSWRRKKSKACLNDIYMKHIFSFSSGVLNQNNRPKGKASLLQYLHEQCGETIDPNYDASSFELEFSANDKNKLFTRGKYVLWFMIEFCKSIHKDCVTMQSLTIAVNPKMHVTVSESNGIIQVAPRAKKPNSLKVFLSNTVEAFTRNQKVA